MPLLLLVARALPRYMGLITAADLQLYGLCCAAGVLGVVAGDHISHYLNQQVFQQVLGALMVLCCLLMLASGLGLVA